ncbi:Oidioi.mRNA.OKI2018_I69.XSR.g16721.t2.cds [Oikopleura dioica]|uniref:Oidioi.mRNA.OKI2018_I69.XSR.g16721.t2.cds n=1 Tax=Oikopleura dioica TaxID=34765 RepID=A0ABN7SH21_OIKDI|nr:Oidioi.mRNA.OKI2018_I69.XSR.g16721.t2.cds [Oikopleura dioica]
MLKSQTVIFSKRRQIDFSFAKLKVSSYRQEQKMAKIDRSKRAPWTYPKYLPEDGQVLAKYYKLNWGEKSVKLQKDCNFHPVSLQNRSANGVYYPGVLQSRSRDKLGWIIYKMKFFDGYVQKNTYEDDIKPYSKKEAIAAKKMAEEKYAKPENKENWFFFHKQVQLELAKPLQKKKMRPGMDILVEEMKEGGPVWVPGIVKVRRADIVECEFKVKFGTIIRRIKYSQIRRLSKKNQQYFNQFHHIHKHMESFSPISSNPAKENNPGPGHESILSHRKRAPSASTSLENASSTKKRRVEN